MARDYYNLLGVSRSASDKEVRQAYRRLARQYHPDLNPGDPKAEARFKEINEAYQVLSNPKSRQQYDAYGEQWRYADQFQRQGAGGPFRWAGASPGGRRSAGAPGTGFGGFNDLGDLFGDLLGFSRPRRATAEETVRRQPLETPVAITLEEAYHGATRLVQVASDPRAGAPGRRLEVKIPPGTDTGSRVHIAAGDRRSGRTDLYLLVTVSPHQRFERKGDDLYTTAPVDLVDAVLGGEVEVPTIKGAQVALKVPQETQNGRTFRLKGQGMPRRSDTGQYGDLYATVRVVLPAKLSDAERELFRQLKEARSPNPQGSETEVSP